jgi:tripartite-type tricarboxylate transporter receptor subunit TctC
MKKNAALAVSMAFFQLCLFASGIQAALAQSHETIHIVVSSAASTPPDIISRIVARELAESEGWNVIVENKPGGAGIVAGNDVLNRPAEGSTIMAIFLPNVSAPALLKMPYRLDSDFAPLIKVSVSYNVLVVNPSVPARTVSELVALIRQHPDTMTFSSGGYGTPAHLIGEMFSLKIGGRAAHVPYQQLSQAVGDLMGGVNQYMFVTMLPVVDIIAAGKLQALAVTAPQRIHPLGEVPSISEEGFSDLVVEDWVGFVVKKGTPTEDLKKLNLAINRALAAPTVVAAFARLGAKPAGGTQEEFGALVTSQLAYWKKIVTETGIKIQQ